MSAFEQSGDHSADAKNLFASGVVLFEHLEALRSHLGDLGPYGPPGPKGARLLVGLHNWQLILAQTQLENRLLAEAKETEKLVTSAAGSSLSLAVERAVDGLRYPLSEISRRSQTTTKALGEDWLRAMSLAVEIGTQYSDFETMWLECLWGDHEILRLPNLDVFRPSDLLAEAQRVVGRTRRDALATEIAAHSWSLWAAGPPSAMASLARRPRVAGTTRSGKKTSLTVAVEEPEDPPESMVLRAIATEFYDAPLLKEPLPKFGGLTADELLDCWEVLQPLAAVLRKRMPRVDEITSPNQLRQCAPTFERKALAEALEEALDLSGKKALAAVSCFTFPNDPRQDLWFYPFVDAGQGRVAVLIDVLESPNLLRSLEHWLATGGVDLDARGRLFEQWVRSHLRRRCTLYDADISSKSLNASVSGSQEEVDCVLRVGATVLVAEIKCTVRPSTPIAEHRYAQVLGDAATQARRKAGFVQEHYQVVARELDWRPDRPEEPDVQPLVITNLPLGLGRRLEGVPVVDLTSFAAFLSRGVVRRGVVLDGGKETGGERVPLVPGGGSEDKALARFLESPPQLDAFYDHLAVHITRPTQFHKNLDAVCRVSLGVNIPQLMSQQIPGSDQATGGM